MGMEIDYTDAADVEHLASYQVIENIRFDIKNKSVEMCVSAYKDRASRIAGKSPINIAPYRIQISNAVMGRDIERNYFDDYFESSLLSVSGENIIRRSYRALREINREVFDYPFDYKNNAIDVQE